MRRIEINGNGLGNRKPKNLEIIDCVIISDLVVFVDILTESLIIYNIRGSFERSIKLSGVPQGITAINHEDVAVLNNRSSIQIISIYTGHVKNQIGTCGNSCKGISYQDGLLFIYVHEKSTIDVLNLKGDIIRSFLCPKSRGIRTLQCLATDIRRLILIDGVSSNIFCLNLHGSLKWKFLYEGKIREPNGITIDGIGNVYVSSYSSRNVVVISPDGNLYKELLTTKDGLVSPRGIYYEKSSNYMLVCDECNGYALFFHVIDLSIECLCAPWK